MKYFVTLILFILVLSGQQRAHAQCTPADRITMRLRVVCNNGPGDFITIAVDLKKTSGRCIGGYGVHFHYTASKMIFNNTQTRYPTQYWTDFQDHENNAHPELPRYVKHKAPYPGNALPLDDTTYFPKAKNCNNNNLNDGYVELLRFVLRIHGGAQGTANFDFFDWLPYKSGGGAPGGLDTFIWNVALTDNFNETRIELTNVVVPVELIAFNAQALPSGDVRLTWKTVSETSNFGFDIERRNGESWDKIGFVKGAGTTSHETEYSFIDSPSSMFSGDVLSSGGTLNYRLKQIDVDGKSAYSQIAAIEFAPRKFSLGQAFPNPMRNLSAGSVTTIPFELPAESQVNLTLYNSLGQVITELLPGNQLPAGYHFVEWDGRSLRGERMNTGTYFYRLTATLSNGESISSMKKFVVIE